MSKKRIMLYVEGGGDSDSLHSDCRRGFASFLEKAGLAGSMPRIVACGSRNDAYDRFSTACKQNDENIIPVLLVDSENAVAKDCESDSDCKNWKPWEHLKTRDNWDKPQNASDEQCNLMVACMENWFVADIETLKSFYGHCFDEKKIPNKSDIEKINKSEIYVALSEATKNTKTKGKYSKGEHSFEILAMIDSSLVAVKSKWAKRLIDYLKNL